MALWSYHRTVLLACTLAFFATMVARLAISPVVPAIEAEFEVSSAAVGLALSGMWLTYALSQFPSGLLADRIGERRVILIAIFGTAIASTVTALSPLYGVFLVGTAVLGVFAGLHFSVAVTLLTRELENTGSAIGIHNAGAPLAGLVTPIAAGVVGVWFGWRYAVALGVLIAVPVAILFARSVRPTSPTHPDERIRDRLQLGSVVGLLFRRPIAFTTTMAVGGAFVWQATASFLPAFLISHHGYSELLAGVVFSVYFVAQGVGQPAIGILSDRIGRLPAATVSIFSGVVGYTLYVLGGGLVAIAIATVLAGVAMSWGAALMPRFMDFLAPEEQGSGFGLVRTVYMVLGASGSVVTGAIADLFGWGIAFLTLAGVLGVVLVALLGAMIVGRVGSGAVAS